MVGLIAVLSAVPAVVWVLLGLSVACLVFGEIALKYRDDKNDGLALVLLAGTVVFFVAALFFATLSSHM